MILFNKENKSRLIKFFILLILLVFNKQFSSEESSIQIVKEKGKFFLENIISLSKDTLQNTLLNQYNFQENKTKSIISCISTFTKLNINKDNPLLILFSKAFSGLLIVMFIKKFISFEYNIFSLKTVGLFYYEILTIISYIIIKIQPYLQHLSINDLCINNIVVPNIKLFQVLYEEENDRHRYIKNIIIKDELKTICCFIVSTLLRLLIFYCLSKFLKTKIENLSFLLQVPIGMTLGGTDYYFNKNNKALIEIGNDEEE
jgi:hypothetical protein